MPANLTELRERKEQLKEKYNLLIDSARLCQHREHLIFTQAVSGAFDNLSDAVVLDKFNEMDRLKDDRQDSLKQAMDIEAERRAINEKIVNILRVRIGLPEMPPAAVFYKEAELSEPML